MSEEDKHSFQSSSTQTEDKTPPSMNSANQSTTTDPENDIRDKVRTLGLGIEQEVFRNLHAKKNKTSAYQGKEDASQASVSKSQRNQAENYNRNSSNKKKSKSGKHSPRYQAPGDLESVIETQLKNKYKHRKHGNGNAQAEEVTAHVVKVNNKSKHEQANKSTKIKGGACSGSQCSSRSRDDQGYYSGKQTNSDEEDGLYDYDSYYSNESDFGTQSYDTDADRPEQSRHRNHHFRDHNNRGHDNRNKERCHDRERGRRHHRERERDCDSYDSDWSSYSSYSSDCEDDCHRREEGGVCGCDLCGSDCCGCLFSTATLCATASLLFMVV